MATSNALHMTVLSAAAHGTEQLDVSWRVPGERGAYRAKHLTADEALSKADEIVADGGEILATYRRVPAETIPGVTIPMRMS
jgi:hypothetical protein